MVTLHYITFCEVFLLQRKFCSKKISSNKEEEASFMFDPLKLDEIRSTGKKMKR
jgi:hypothetical protein